MSAAYRIKPIYNELRVEFDGSFSDSDAAELERELQRMISVMPVGRYNVLMDMMGMTNYSTSARDVLVRVQKSFAEFAKRTAYVANRPNIRGMALWVAHLSGDQNAKAVASHDQVKAWWGTSSGREAEIRRAL
ncbi:MAG: hypothetical protein JNJ46_08245 [Myxococcales bacterium]|nr:hypothetical protein [Myxococcales bacterium]